MFCLCLCFKFNPTPKLHIDSSIPNATYASGILAEEIGSAVEKIEDWLGKPVVITCDEVTTAQLPHVIEWAWHTNGVQSVVFNTRVDDMQSDSNQSVKTGYQSYVGGPAVGDVVDAICCLPIGATLDDIIKNLNGYMGL